MKNSPDFLPALSLSLRKLDLSSSQRKRCLALFALQDDPYGLMSQWLYSKSLQQGNRQSETISRQQSDLQRIEHVLAELEDEIDEKEAQLHQREALIAEQQGQLDQATREQEDLSTKIRKQEAFTTQLFLGREILMELIASQMEEIEKINRAKLNMAREISRKEQELEHLNDSVLRELQALKHDVDPTDENAGLVEALDQLTSLNELLYQSLNEALAEIQKLMGLNN